jgi:5-methylcytosine-specific restriction protein B
MSAVPVAWIMWRLCEKATYDTLHGSSKGQYHIAIPDREEFHKFFGGLPRTATELEGYELEVPIEPFEGDSPVEAWTLPVRYMGKESARKDWNIIAQRPDTAYPLWGPGRGVPGEYETGWREYLVIVRDVHGSFHARWIGTEDFEALPQWVRETLLSDKYGARRYR